MNNLFKLSKYTVAVHVDDKVIVFSTISKATVLFSEDEFMSLVNSDFCLFSKSQIDELIDFNILVNKDLNEKDMLWCKMNSSRLRPSTLSTFIMFSTLCNFSCVYCYERGQVVDQIIDNNSYCSLIKWYKNKLNDHQYKDLKVIFYGGEPLLHLDLIKRFTSDIRCLCADNDVNLYLEIITNGYLLTPDIVSYLVSNGLENIQITLDGISDVHNSHRPLKSGGPTFDKIIKNISDCKDLGSDITIRASFNKSNVTSLCSLLYYLSDLNLTDLEIYFSPIHQTILQLKDNSSFCSNNVFNDDDCLPIYHQLYS